MSVKSILGWAALAFVVWWVVENPPAATHVVSNIGHWLTAAVHGISSFFGSI